MKVGDVLDNGYRISRSLGVGGLAEVFLAERAGAEPQAVKVLLPLNSRSAILRLHLADEADRMEQLDHPNIVDFKWYGQIGNTPALVMEFADGGCLKDLLKESQPLPFVVLVAKSIASAIDYCHAQGILHRDITPGNILFVNGMPKLGDFGIALPFTPNIEDSMCVPPYGTPHYMALEAMQGNPCRASDQYGLAATIYSCLVGRTPYYYYLEDHHGLAKFLLNPQGGLLDTLPLPSGIPEGLAHVLRQGLAVSHAARFPDVTTLAQALAESLQTYTIRTWTYRPQETTETFATNSVSLC